MTRSLRAVLLSLVPLAALACRVGEPEVPSLVLPTAGAGHAATPSSSSTAPPPGPVVADEDALAPTHVPKCIDPVRDPLPIHPASRHRVVRASYDLQRAFLPAMEANDPQRPALALRLGTDEMQLAYLEPGGSHEADAEAHFAIASKAAGEVGLEGKYRLALAFECSGRLNEERVLLLAIVQADPKSTLAPFVYFAFGELFRAEAASDPTKYGIAVQAYQKVREFPASPLATAAAERARECHGRLNAQP